MFGKPIIQTQKKLRKYIRVSLEEVSNLTLIYNYRYFFEKYKKINKFKKKFEKHLFLIFFSIISNI